MPNFSLIVALMFFGSIAAQIFGISMLPLTKGLTVPLPTLAAACGFLIGVGLLARLSHSGVNLSTLIPLMSTVIPLASIALGILIYGESVSITKLMMLVSACALIGFASAV
jgi:multidrug transporter EmrE-like cation transporter